MSDDWPRFRLNGWDRSEDSENNFVLELGFFRVRLQIDRHLYYVSRHTKPFPSLAHAEQYIWELIVDTFQDINEFVLAHERTMTADVKKDHREQAKRSWKDWDDEEIRRETEPWPEDVT